MLALHDGQPLCLSLRSMLEAFLVFREQVVTRRTQYLLRKARERGHVLMGLALAVHRIDDVIAMIKAAPDPVSAREALMATDWPVGMIAPYLEAIEGVLLEGDGLYRLSEAQAKAILDMRLHRLTQLEHRKILDDVEALVRDIASYKEILASRLRMKAVMHDEFQEILDRFDTPRRTEIHPHAHDCDEEDLIQREDMVVTVTVAGYIKRTPLAVYRSQRRGGRGRAALTMREEDATIQVVMTHTHAPLLFFSSHGKVYKMKVHKLPLGTPQSKGRALVNLLPLASGEVIRTILPLPEDAASWGELNILFATMEGNIRRNSLADFASIQSNGKIAIRLDPSDQLVGVELCQDEEHVLLCTAQGKAIRFPAGSLRVFKSRTSDGVRGMKLQAEDRVISLTILRSAEGDTATREAYLRVPLETRRRWALDAASVESIDLPDGLSLEQAVNMAKDEEFVLAVTANGFGKQTSAYEYRTTHRGGSGITHMMTSDRNGSVVSSFPVSEADDVLLLTNAGRLIRVPSSGVRVSGRATHGVMLLRVDDQEHVVSAARVVETDASEEENSAPDLAGEE
jgi:DNA gyrase subunit A